jgi:F0F1-type ATP synthase membrane subunit c/vacuolar-type H+-ATPase subunit K
LARQLIEIISFLSRPISHSVRLFANMLAGHITLKVFGGFVVMLLGAGSFAVLAPLPLLMAVAITALEVLVAFLQAYVFTMLTCMYLNDALHPRTLIRPPLPAQPQEHPWIPPPRSHRRRPCRHRHGAAAIGVGNLFGQFLQGALRNPSAADGQFGRLIFGFAVTEALGIFALLIAFLLLFT